MEAKISERGGAALSININSPLSLFNLWRPLRLKADEIPLLPALSCSLMTEGVVKTPQFRRRNDRQLQLGHRIEQYLLVSSAHLPLAWIHMEVSSEYDLFSTRRIDLM
jgi:hypothetical protein